MSSASRLTIAFISSSSDSSKILEFQSLTFITNTSLESPFIYISSFIFVVGDKISSMDLLD